MNDFGLALEIIQNNNNIPLILTNNENQYISHKNLKILDVYPSENSFNIIDSIIQNWSRKNSPIEFNYYENRVQKYIVQILQNAFTRKTEIHY